MLDSQRRQDMADSCRFTLYMHVTSFYVQKVLLALYEKGEPFNEKLVNNGRDENFEPWFMKMNPAGKVPVLEDRGKFISESENIIDFLDAEITRAPRLVPDLSTDYGQEVQRFRKLLDVNVPLLVNGVLYHPDLTPTGKTVKKRSVLDAAIETRILKLERLASEHPDLADSYLDKIPPLKKQREDRRDLKLVKKVLDDLQTTMDLVENRIVKSRKDSCSETWLFGSDYTAADISLTMLLRRLSQLGISSLYFTESKRPALYIYWEQLQTRSAYCKLGDIVAKYSGTV